MGRGTSARRRENGKVMGSGLYKFSKLRNITQHKMNFVKIQNAKVDNFKWTEYSFLFFGKYLWYYDTKLDELYSFSLWGDGKRVSVRNSKENFELECNSLSLFGFTVVWRFESTVVDFIKDVWSKITA
jgi:hypothetical protein